MKFFFLPLVCLSAFFLMPSCHQKQVRLEGEISRTVAHEKPRLEVVRTNEGIWLSPGSGAYLVSSQKDAPYFFDEKNMSLYVFESGDNIKMMDFLPPAEGREWGETRLFVFKKDLCPNASRKAE